MALLAGGWAIAGVRACIGMLKLPRLEDVAVPAAPRLRVSVLVAARNEAARLPRAMAGLLAQDYANYEVVAVDDRSGDATPQILDDLAGPKLKVVHVKRLPPGWLGKPHALQTAYEHSTGEWLVFTDADVWFAPDLLSRVVALAEQRALDHVTLLCPMEMHGFGEKVAVNYWTLGFLLAFEPWRVANPRSKRFLGVGAFQMVRRAAYQAIGTHRRLAMEVVDDMKLGMLIKQAGLRSAVALADERMSLRWQEGLGNVVRGLTKNAFAAGGYRLRTMLVYILGLLAFSILPFAAAGFASGTARALALAACAAAVASQMLTAHGNRISLLYGFTHPLGAAIMVYILARSTAVTLWRGGVTWRGTFYPLDELRKGVVE
jgi:hypothetical protein